MKHYILYKLATGLYIENIKYRKIIYTRLKSRALIFDSKLIILKIASKFDLWIERA